MRRTGIFAVSVGLFCLGITGAQAQGNYPIMDWIAQRVVQKYQTSSCEQLAAQRAPAIGGNAEPDGAAGRPNAAPKPAKCEAFLNRMAGPIANKLFECGMIP